MRAPARRHGIWLGKTLLALAVGYLGGAIFTLLHIPLPWMLGSLAAAATLAALGIDWKLSAIFRNVTRPTIGVLAGSSFTPAVAAAMLGWWPAVLTLIVFYLAITILGWLYFTRLCGQDDTTAVFSATPGGLGELTLLGSQLGGNVRVLVSVHTMRVVATVIALPFIVRWLAGDAGAAATGIPVIGDGAPLRPVDWALLVGCGALGFLLGRPFKRFGGIMIGPLILSALVHVLELTHSGPPAWFVILMQVVIGSIVGSRFAGISATELRNTAVQAIGWAAISLGATILVALLARSYIDVSLPALILAFAPGGFAEMTILAYAIGAEVAFVVCCHVLRAMSVVMLAPAMASVITGRRGQGGQPPPK